MKAKTGDDTTDSVYQKWYSDVCLLSVEETPEVQPTANIAKASTANKAVTVKEG